MKTLFTQKGQTLLETVVTLPILILVTTGLLSLAYLALGQKLLSHWVYKTNICLAKDYQVSFCKKQLVTLQKLLSLIHI